MAQETPSRSPGAEPGREDGAQKSRDPRWSGLRRAGPAVGSALVYAGAAIFAYHRILFASASSMPGCNCGDQAQEVWFLRWPLYAVTHGQSLFFTSWMNYPKGVNLAINTVAPLLGLASAPLQLTIGTVATYDVLLCVALVTSALAMCFALRRWVRSWLAAFAGGLLYGFSPYMIGQGSGHLFLVALFVPPIVLVLVDEIVVKQRHNAVRDGVLLGVLLVVEYFISPEVLAMMAVMGGCGVVLLALVCRNAVRAHARHVLVAALCCAIVCAAALAYPVWFSVHGAQHVVGPPHPLEGLADFPGDLLGPVLPTVNQFLAPGFLSSHGNALVGFNPDENGMYLGLPMIVVLIVFARVFRNRRALLFFVAMAVVATILSLGPQLVVDGHHTGVPLPAWILEHLPLVKGTLDVRFSLFTQMSAAAALAIGLDEMVRRAGARAGARAAARGHSPAGAVTHVVARLRAGVAGAVGALGAPVVVAVVALLPLLPAAAYPPGLVSAPAFYTSPAADRIPEGAVVLTYPYPLVADAEWNLTFQVEAGMRYKVFGDDGFVPDGPGHSGISTPTPPAPAVVEHLLSDAYTPTFAKVRLGTPPGTPTARVDPASVTALRTFLRRYHVDAVVVDDLGLHPLTVVDYVSDALSRPPEQTGGVWVWFDVPRLLARVDAAR